MFTRIHWKIIEESFQYSQKLQNECQGMMIKKVLWGIVDTLWYCGFSTIRIYNKQLHPQAEETVEVLQDFDFAVEANELPCHLSNVFVDFVEGIWVFPKVGVFPPNPWNFNGGVPLFSPSILGGKHPNFWFNTQKNFPVIYGYIRGSKIEAILRIPGWSNISKMGCSKGKGCLAQWLIWESHNQTLKS